jgi:DNA invertase Pin-like site-specific DNA recombinase
MLYFVLLEPERQAEAIRRLAVMGQSVQTIASATGLAVEAVRRVLDSQQSPASSANIVGADE